MVEMGDFVENSSFEYMTSRETTRHWMARYQDVVQTVVIIARNRDNGLDTELYHVEVMSKGTHWVTNEVLDFPLLIGSNHV